MMENLEMLSYLATVLGIPIAIGVFIFEMRKQRVLQELTAHEQSNDRYIRYLERCLDSKDFSACEFRPEDKDVITSGLTCQTLVMFCILVSMFETAYFRYKYVHLTARNETWSGWEKYITDWFTRENFRIAWPLVSPQFNKSFVSEVNRLIENAK